MLSRVGYRSILFKSTHQFCFSFGRFQWSYHRELVRYMRLRTDSVPPLTSGPPTPLSGSVISFDTVGLVTVRYRRDTFQLFFSPNLRRTSKGSSEPTTVSPPTMYPTKPNNVACPDVASAISASNKIQNPNWNTITSISSITEISYLLEGIGFHFRIVRKIPPISVVIVQSAGLVNARYRRFSHRPVLRRFR